MRIGTAWLHEQGVLGMMGRQSDLARIQQQLTTGSRLTRAGDDPAAAEAAQLLDATASQLERYGKNGDALRHRLNLEESTLGTMSDRLARVRELLVQANTGAQSSDSRNAIATELRAILDETVSLANANDGTGRYLFAGTQDGTQPFALTAGGISYSGDQVQRRVDVSAQMTLGDVDPGSAVFLAIRDGNGLFSTRGAATNTGNGTIAASSVADPAAWDGGTYRITFNAGTYSVLDAGNVSIASGAYVPGTAIEFRGARIVMQGTPATGDEFTVGPSRNQDLFTMLQSAITAVSTNATTPAMQAAQQNSFFAALENLGQIESHVSDVRGGVGSRLQAIDLADDERAGAMVQLKSQLSTLRDTDYTEAASRMQMTLTALEAAQASFMRVNSLSLFDYLR